MLIGYNHVNCHMIFDVRMNFFHRKARFVAVGHMRKPPFTITYTIIMLRETVRIVLTVSAWKDLSAKVVDIQNAYITAPVTEKI